MAAIGRMCVCVMGLLLACPAMAQLPDDRSTPPVIRTDAKPKDDVNTVTIEGRGTSKDAAVQDALRNAVERAAGQFIHSQTETKNYAAVLDKVLSKSAGFVKRYNVNKVSAADVNGIITVEITADVAVKEVATEWGEIQILLQQKGKPRLMVVIAERIDGQKEGDSTVASEIEKLLLKNDFPLVDKGQFNEVQKRDINSAAFEDDITKVVALGKQFGAELIITGSSQADFGSEEDLYGVKAFMYGTTVKVKVVRTDNAATLFSDNVSTRKGARTKTGGAHDALQAAGMDMAKRVQDGIVAKWGREVAESQSVKLEVNNITFAQRSKLTETLKGIKKVKDVQQREFANKVANYTVDVKCSSDDFAKILSEMKELKLEVTDVTANVIKCKVTE